MIDIRVRAPESAMIPGMSAPMPRVPAATTLPAVAGPVSYTGGFPNIPDSSVPGPLAQLAQPGSWIYDFDPATGSKRATYQGEVSYITGTFANLTVTGNLTVGGNLTVDGTAQLGATTVPSLTVTGPAGALIANGITFPSGTLTYTAGGVIPITDVSGAGLGTLGNLQWFGIGEIVVGNLVLTWPSQSNALNNEVGLLPFPVKGQSTTCFFRSSAGSPTIFGAAMAANQSTLQFYNSTGAIQTNGGFSGVTLYGTVVYIGATGN